MSTSCDMKRGKSERERETKSDQQQQHGAKKTTKQYGADGGSSTHNFLSPNFSYYYFHDRLSPSSFYCRRRRSQRKPISDSCNGYKGNLSLSRSLKNSFYNRPGRTPSDGFLEGPLALSDERDSVRSTENPGPTVRSTLFYIR